MFFDLIIDHTEAKNTVDTLRWAGFLKLLQDRFPERKLYAVSQDWYEDSQYICKARGISGDIIVYWTEKMFQKTGI